MSKTVYTTLAIDAEDQGHIYSPFLPSLEEVASLYNKQVPTINGGNEESVDDVRVGRTWTIAHDRMRAIKLIFLEKLQEHVGVRKSGIKGACNTLRAAWKKSELIEEIEALSELLNQMPAADAKPEYVEQTLFAASHEFGGSWLRPSKVDQHAGLVKHSMYSLYAFMALQLLTLHPNPIDIGHLRAYWAALGQPPKEAFLGKAFAYKGWRYVQEQLPHGGSLPTRTLTIDPAWLRADACLSRVALDLFANRGLDADKGERYYSGAFLDGNSHLILFRAFRDILSCTLGELRATLDTAHLMQSKIMGGVATVLFTAISASNKHVGDGWLGSNSTLG